MSNKKDIKRDNPWTGVELEELLEWDLEKESTRSLILMLRSQYGREDEILRSRLKTILASREHIPTVKEAKELRKQRSRERKHR